MDSFLGSGTTAIQATANGRLALGADVHPTAIEIASARLAPVYPAALEQAVDDICRVLAHGRPSRVALPDDPGGFKWEDWFPAASHPVLSQLRIAIHEKSSGNVRRLLLVATAGSLKQVSYWYSHATKLQFDPNKEPCDVRSTMVQRLAEVKKINRDLWDHVGGRHGAARRRASARFAVADCRALPFDSESVDLAVSSPPYFIAYDYAKLLRLSSWWILGEVPTGQEHLETGGRGTALPDEAPSHLRQYFGQFFRRTMRQWNSKRPKYSSSHVSALIRSAVPFFDGVAGSLSEVFRVLKPSGKLCLVLGNTRHCGIVVPTAEIASELALYQGFDPVAIHVRRQYSATQPQARDNLGQFTSRESPSQYSYRDEYVIVLRKPRRARRT